MQFGEIPPNQSLCTATVQWKDALQSRDKQGRRFILEIGTQPTLSTNDPTSPSDYYSCIDTNTTNTTTHTTELAEQTDLTDPSSSTAAVTQAQTAPKSWASLFKSNTINQQHNHHHKQHYNNAQPRTYKDFKDLIQNYRPSMQPRILEPRGFVNRGNMCFMNAILQPLVFCAPFYNLLSTIASTVPHSFGISKTPILDALIRLMQEFSESSSDQELTFGDPILPEYIFDALQANEKVLPLLKGRQEDAEEYLGLLLDGIHEELIQTLRSDTQTSAVTVDNWIEVGVKNKPLTITKSIEIASSPITRIFGGELRSIVRSFGLKDSITIQPFHSLQLDITPDDVVDIRDAIRNLAKPELLDGFCSPAGEKAETVKIVQFESLPRILILHLKRFTYQNGQIHKVAKHVRYGQELLFDSDILSTASKPFAPIKYKLNAVVFHHGKKAVDGHYTCELMRADGKWLHFDDSIVTQISPVDALSSDGADSNSSNKKSDRSEYLLFYQMVL